MKTFEVNFDGLVGPTHNYAGLAYGNLPSASSRYSISSPKKAALEGLAKMSQCLSLGLVQGIVPPQERPDLTLLREAGFSGSDKKILADAYKQRPQLLFQCYSAASMWTANAATISPSVDTQDHRVQITPANLISQGHRSIEADQTAKVLKMMCANSKHFIHHPPLPYDEGLGDEGAANHMRLSARHGEKGVEIFVYGKDISDSKNISSKKYPARQNLKASRTIALTHLLDERYVVFAQQSPEAIDQGVFHNDLVAVANENVFLYHQKAFADKDKVIAKIRQKLEKLSSGNFFFIEIQENCLSIKESVETFFFNSQIVTLPNGVMALLAPKACEDKLVKPVIDEILAANNPICEVYYVDLHQSMSNGGGPACLRLRMVLTEEEYQHIHPGFLLNDLKICLLEEWIHQYFRDQLSIEDLQEVTFLKESRRALAELTKILNLGDFYGFQ
ncbi:Succinylarginine dihydrolase [hydrothermal vent metagenome]|uniref:Succinylarginine dihydrolase n=1 Tax=hydrothermal vent metagenome TaxID=652676 RepID=A0A3B1DLW6_9ZZZZ